MFDRLADAAVIAGLAVWALEDGGRPTLTVLLAVAATAGSILSMASKDRVAALRIPPAPERRIGFLLGGRDARLLLVAIRALLGRPEAHRPHVGAQPRRSSADYSGLPSGVVRNAVRWTCAVA